MQFGCRFDGALVAGEDKVSHVSSACQTTLQRGYATLGSDGGHQQMNIHDRSFGLRPEASRNFTGDALKKVRDAAFFLIKARYSEAPDMANLSGGSTGGRETVAVAQRWPQDYDGAIAHCQALPVSGLDVAWQCGLQGLVREGRFR